MSYDINTANKSKAFFCHTQLFNSTAMSGWTFRICNNFTTLSWDQALLTWSTQLSRRHLRQYLWGMKCASWFWDMAIPNYYLHVHSVFFRLCWVAFMLHLLTSTMAGFWHKNVFKYILIVTYTIIQSITSSEMCSLHLTHPSAHTHLEQWAANAAVPREQLGVRCLAQGSHLSRGQFLPEPRFEPTTSDYKSNALSISPRLPHKLHAPQTSRFNSIMLYKLAIIFISISIIFGCISCTKHCTFSQGKNLPTNAVKYTWGAAGTRLL